MMFRRDPDAMCSQSSVHGFVCWIGFGMAMCALAAASGCSRPQPPAVQTSTPRDGASANKHRVIIFIWDGLRPDSVDAQNTPQLARLRDEQGVNFRNHHSVYPTFTMMNAAAFATGARSSVHGFFGNFVYLPGPSGNDASGRLTSFLRPVFVEDYALLHAIDEFLQTNSGSGVLSVETLFQVAHARGLRTAAVGKSGPAFLQDFRQDGSSGVFLDENVVLPRAFASSLQQASLPLPINTVQYAYPEGPLKLSPDNGDPTATEPGGVALDDHATPDPRADNGSPYKKKTAYLMRVYLDYILPKLDPDLSMIWLRNPDTTQHTYGPGSPNAIDALRHQDSLLGQLLQTLEHLGRTSTTDLVIASDHGHSTVASDPVIFPPRALLGAADGHGSIGPIATPGYAVSGEVRTTDLLRRAGFPHVYDGSGCSSSPVLAGIDAQGTPLAATPLECPDGTFDVPQAGSLPDDAIVIAANGGSEYFYVPSHDPQLLKRLARALQERRQYGAVFVHSVYGAVPGTLPLKQIGMEPGATPAPPSPDLVVSFEWNAEATTAVGPHAAGTELASVGGGRGMHGAFGPTDVRATLIAKGPSFRAGFGDDYPSSNLDVAPTVAALLGLELSHAEGRTLDEARAGADVQYSVTPFSKDTDSIRLDKLCELNDLACVNPGPATNYRLRLSGQRLSVGDGKRSFEYYDEARVERTAAP